MSCSSVSGTGWYHPWTNVYISPMGKPKLSLSASRFLAVSWNLAWNYCHWDWLLPHWKAYEISWGTQTWSTTDTPTQWKLSRGIAGVGVSVVLRTCLCCDFVNSTSCGMAHNYTNFLVVCLLLPLLDLRPYTGTVSERFCLLPVK